MTDLTNRPLVCVTLALMAGIALTAAYGTAALVAAAGAAALATLALVCRRTAPVAALALLLAAVLAGGLLYLAREGKPTSDVSRLPVGGQTLIGTVSGVPAYTDGVWRFVLAAEAHEHGARVEPVSGQVYVRLTSTRPVERGQRWRLTGRLRPPRGSRNPGDRPESSILSSLGASAVLTVGADTLAQLLGPGQLDPLSAHAYAAQRAALRLLGRFVSGPYPEQTASVAASVIFGVHATPPPAEISDAFRKAGTIHLLVVSGAMVSMVFGFVFLPGALGAGWRRIEAEQQANFPLSGRGRIRHRPGLIAAALGILVVLYYAVLTEGGQAVARAAVMGVFIGLAFILRRFPLAREHGLNIDRYTLLAVAALCVLAWQPAALLQPGFQLSFVAVWALIYLTPKVDPLVGGFPRWLSQTLIGTVVAQIALFPILVWHYGQAPIGGLGANLLAVPLASVVLTSGMVTCALGPIAPWAASLSGWVMGLSTRWMIWVSTAFASISWASPQVPKPGWIAIIAWYLALLALGWRIGLLTAARAHPSR